MVAEGKGKLAHLHNICALVCGNFQFEILICRCFFFKDITVFCVVKILQINIVGNAMNRLPCSGAFYHHTVICRTDFYRCIIIASVQRPRFGVSAIFIRIIVRGCNIVTADNHRGFRFENYIEPFAHGRAPFCSDIPVEQFVVPFAGKSAGAFKYGILHHCTRAVFFQ